MRSLWVLSIPLVFSLSACGDKPATDIHNHNPLTEIPNKASAAVQRIQELNASNIAQVQHGIENVDQETAPAGKE
jgi:hypothetical protein